MTARREVSALASSAVAAIRAVYCADVPDRLRVAALVEIAGAAASLARTVCRYRHVDPAAVAVLVSQGADVAPVLGRGRWLRSMTWHIAEPAVAPSKRPATQTKRARVSVQVIQPELFPAMPARMVATITGGDR